MYSLEYPRYSIEYIFWKPKSNSGSTSFVIIIFVSREIREIIHGTLAPGRKIFKAWQMERQRQLLVTSRSRIVPGIFFIRERSIQDTFRLLWKVLLFPPLRSILTTISMRQLLSFLMVSHYHYMRIFVLGPV